MIALLLGTLHSINLRSAIILCGDVGYRVHMPLNDLSRVGKPGDKVQLFIHTHVREDALELFGFTEEARLQLFEHLISVSGIGPKMGLAVLSGMSTDELLSNVSHGNHAALTRIPGIGNKIAQRIVLELKDRFSKLDQSFFFSPFKQENTLADLRSAIANLGYKPQTVEKALKQVEPLAKQGQPLESLLKEALRHLN